jgi:cytochrome c peroxidase
MDAALALGRRLFHAAGDAKIAGDGRACASCHPDGREDALTWSTPDGPRQTVMLAGRLSTSAPFGWTGANKTLAGHVTQTFERLGGTGLDKDPSETESMFRKTRRSSTSREDSSEASDTPPKDPGPAFRALMAYLGSLRTPVAEPPPHSAELIARGRSVFFAEGQGACARCHVGGTGVDQQVHNVSQNVTLALDTPSLRFLRGTAPYFHDGRYETLEELLVASDHAMGHPLRLSQRDRAALTAYLETL